MNLQSILAILGVSIALAVFWQNRQMAKKLHESMHHYAATNQDVGILINEFKKFKVAFDYAYDAILIADMDGKVLYCNSSFARVTGFETSEIIGHKAGTLWGGKMPKKYYDHLWKTVKIDRKPFFSVLTNHRKNGEEYQAAVSIAPILNEDQTEAQYFIAVERDLSHNP